MTIDDIKKWKARESHELIESALVDTNNKPLDEFQIKIVSTAIARIHFKATIEELQENPYVSFSFRDFADAMGESHTRKSFREKIEKSCNDLRSSTFSIRTPYITDAGKEDYELKIFGLIDQVVISVDRIEVKFNDTVIPYIASLRNVDENGKLFADYHLSSLYALRGVYHKIIYKLCCKHVNMHEGKFNYSIKELRHILGLENTGKLERWIHFKSVVLDASKKAINKITELNIDYEAYSTVGRSKSHVTFIVQRDFITDTNKDNDWNLETLKTYNVINYQQLYSKWLKEGKDELYIKCCLQAGLKYIKKLELKKEAHTPSSIIITAINEGYGKSDYDNKKMEIEKKEIAYQREKEIIDAEELYKTLESDFEYIIEEKVNLILEKHPEYKKDAESKADSNLYMKDSARDYSINMTILEYSKVDPVKLKQDYFIKKNIRVDDLKKLAWKIDNKDISGSHNEF